MISGRQKKKRANKIIGEVIRDGRGDCGEA